MAVRIIVKMCVIHLRTVKLVVVDMFQSNMSTTVRKRKLEAMPLLMKPTVTFKYHFSTTKMLRILLPVPWYYFVQFKLDAAHCVVSFSDVLVLKP